MFIASMVSLALNATRWCKFLPHSRKRHTVAFHSLLHGLREIHNVLAGSQYPIKTPLRLMPLGGSITYGIGSSDGNGYRDTLRQLLASDGYQVEMVGSRQAGTMEGNLNEGWRGFRIEQIEQRAKKSVPTFQPTLFTINAGSNDCIQNFELNHAASRMEQLLEYLWKTCPTSTIVLSTLLVSANIATEARLSHVNADFRDMVRKQCASGRKIVLAEMRGIGAPRLDELVDGTHPNDQGYSKMGQIYFKGIQEAASRGFLS